MEGIVPIDKEEYIVLGLTACDKERKKRTREATQLLKRLFETEGFRETSPMFVLLYIPYIEALNSYQNGAFKSTIVMCRATIETAFYILSLIESFEWENDSVFPNKYDETLDLVNKELGNRMYKVWAEILEQTGLIDKEMKKTAEKIREKGNIAAHWGISAIKNYEKIMNEYYKKTHGDLDKFIETGLERVSKFFRLSITNKEALEYLELTTELLSKLIENTYQMAQVKNVNHDNGINTGAETEAGSRDQTIPRRLRAKDINR